MIINVESSSIFICTGRVRRSGRSLLFQQRKGLIYEMFGWHLLIISSFHIHVLEFSVALSSILNKLFTEKSKAMDHGH